MRSSPKRGTRLKDGSFYVENPPTRRAARKGPRKASTDVTAAHVGASVTAVGIGASIADTGPLPAGDYHISAHAASDGVVAAGKSLVLVHRNAADSGDVKELGGCPPAGGARIDVPRITLALNERIRWRGGAVAHGAGEIARAHIEAVSIPA